MEIISKIFHPSIIRHKRYRVQRGRITGILLDKYQLTLEQFVESPGPKDADLDSSLSVMQSAVDARGLAHNSINPGNIMMGENNKPVLIDFGSCQPFGKLLQTFGTPGWFEKEFRMSEKKHGVIPMGKLRQWMTDTKLEKSDVTTDKVAALKLLLVDNVHRLTLLSVLAQAAVVLHSQSPGYIIAACDVKLFVFAYKLHVNCRLLFFWRVAKKRQYCDPMIRRSWGGWC
ncbi:hypothetical protein EDB82DRAFT_553981 [Fusarium venenatum]|uniref:uncharacterized protein n=1 Tax=Fusarium venenatum TaxID=56646 RepID=UPI001D7A7C49|nr:hypothetical protein EDB82DRAFT_553981 [Fusarium venenatum]